MDLEGGRWEVDGGDPGNHSFKEGLEFLMAFRIDFPWAIKSEEIIEFSESNILMVQNKVLQLTEFAVLYLLWPTSWWWNRVSYFTPGAPSPVPCSLLGWVAWPVAPALAFHCGWDGADPDEEEASVTQVCLTW